MNQINTAQVRLLTELLEKSEHLKVLVNAKRFRADHFDEIASIDDLVRKRLVLAESDTFRLSIASLPHLETAAASALLERAEALWKVFRKHYKAHLDQPLFLSTAAEQSKLDIDTARRTMNYMFEYPWWGGRSTPADRLYETICVSEKVLSFETFRDCIADMASWHRLDLSSGQNLSFLPSLGDLDSKPIVDATAVPDWTCQLPKEIQSLVREVYIAKSSNLPALCAMGIRAAIDVTSVAALGYDAGVFGTKLNKLRDAGHITEIQRNHLAAVVDAGSAAAHRGLAPESDAVSTMLDAMQHLLQAHYLYPEKTEALVASTPPRKPAKSPPSETVSGPLNRTGPHSG